MPEEKVSVLIKLNKNIHEALVYYKSMTGLSVSSQIYSAIAEWLYKKELITYKGKKKYVD